MTSSDDPDPRDERDPLPHAQRRARRPRSDVALRRSRDRVVAGVAGGIARFIGAPPLALRILLVAALPLTGGLMVPAYLLLWWLIPSEGR